MNSLVATLPQMPQTAIDSVKKLEDELLKMPQVHITTENFLHAGMYARTIMIPAGVILTGVIIKIPTMLIFSGDAIVYTANGPEHWQGYRTVLAPENRKQAFFAQKDTYLTMTFPTSAKTVEEAEEEFTDEADRLLSRKQEA